MSVFSRLAIFYFILLSAALSYAWHIFYDDIKPSFRQISEESMVDASNLLAELIAPSFRSSESGLDSTDFAAIHEAVKRFHKRDPKALIWSFEKNSTNMQFYITDQLGEVIYHSYDPSQLGEDYSQWRDVYRTLLGEYGARTSRRDEEDPESGQMYVAAPIVLDKNLVGVFTLIKPHQSILPFIGEAEFRLTAAGLLLLALLTLSGLALVFWYKRMLDQLTNYVDRVRNGKKASQPRFEEKGFSQLSDALQQLRSELDGKLYVENYIHTLTHELKSPIAAIAAATELLQTNLEPSKRQQFMGNIEAEVSRMQQIIEQLLLLASLENQQSSKEQMIALDTLLNNALVSMNARLSQKNITLNIEDLKLEGLNVRGDAFLLSTAISNLLTNALDFCPAEGHITIASQCSRANAKKPVIELSICNTSAAIPDYAKPRLFERFFSTTRPDNNRKSSGLGLCVAEQVIQLHNGSISLSNSVLNNDTAVLAFVVLPLAKSNNGGILN